MEHEAAIRRAAVNGEYHLLLGAGVSLGARSQDGTPLPNSIELARELAEEFAVDIEDGDLLWRIYDRASVHGDPDQLYDWLKGRFWNCQPPSWMDALTRFPWHTVWTLNIDDAFEKSYYRSAVETSRRISTINWDDPAATKAGYLPIVHLHGHVADHRTRRLIFSLSEYKESIETANTWSLLFRDCYGVSPFIIIGARLKDEPDIEAIVKNRSPESAPSLYISPKITRGMRSDLQSWNLTPIEATAEEFISNFEELTGVSLQGPPSSDLEVGRRFGRQFLELTTNRDVREPETSHDFMGGDPPEWHDIVSNLYAELDWVREGISIADNWNSLPHASGALVYTGRRLTGRSAGLLIIAKQFRKRAWRTFFFTGNERMDIDAVARFAIDGNHLLLAFDGIADIADDIRELLNRARLADVSVAILAVDHMERETAIIDRIPREYFARGSVRQINTRLTRTDATHLVDHLNNQGRLGVLEPRSDSERIAYFRNQELFSSLAHVENAPAFGARVRNLTENLSERAEILLSYFSAIASKVDRTLLIIDAARMLGIDSDEVVRISNRPTARELLRQDGKRISTRHRWLALDPLMSKLGPTESRMELVRAVRRLSGRANRVSHSERNATTLLIGSLMVYRNIVSILGETEIEAWYDDLHSSFGDWSARYWEQRAILYRRKGSAEPSALARAESYAQRAVSLVGDSFSYTTLGTVLLARAAAASIEDLASYYDRAFDAFEAAKGIDRKSVITWLAYLQHTLPVIATALVSNADIDLRLRLIDDWRIIHSELESLSSHSEQTESQLRNLKIGFRDLTATPIN